MLGLITGSGFYNLPQLQNARVERITTSYGAVDVTHAAWNGEHPVVFVARHGADHSIAPHLINYRANIDALAQVGVTAIVATAVSGGITERFAPGDLVVITDFLDFTSGREATFFDTPGNLAHTDMTTAYDPALSQLIVDAAAAEGVPITHGATYCTFNGPRFESPAEIRMAAIVGGDLVGMTGYPEVALARERGLAYASIGIVSNKAAGLGDELTLDDIMATLHGVADALYRVIDGTITAFSSAQ